MGSKLNTASSRGVDTGAMGDAAPAAPNATTIPVDVVKTNGQALLSKLLTLRDFIGLK